MSITPLPTPPSRNDPTNFATRADAFLGALPTFATEANALAVEANADAAAAAQSAIDATNNGAAQVALAAAQAGIATTQAGISTTQAGIATTQAGIATTKATEASASADAAAASAANISLGEKLNLGAKASDPTVDNQGDPLLGGAIYYNTVAEETRQWTGTFWKAAATAVNGTASRQTFTATASQTTFPIVYDIGFVDVYLNGLKLQTSVDFTATNGTSIVLTSPATAADVVDIVAYGAFSLANTYTQAQTDTMLAAKASLTGTETLSNKTLDDPIITLDGSEGTAGQVPVSQGAGLAPVWGSITVPPTDRVLLGTYSAASASMVTIESLFSTAYEDYEVVIDNLQNTARTFGLFMQIKVGSSWLTASYDSSVEMILASSDSGGPFNVYGYAEAVASAVRLTLPSGASIGEISFNSAGKFDGRVTLRKPGFAKWPQFDFDVSYAGSTDGTARNLRRAVGISGHPTVGPVTGVRFYTGGGSWSGGKFRLYGLRPTA